MTAHGKYHCGNTWLNTTLLGIWNLNYGAEISIESMSAIDKNSICTRRCLCGKETKSGNNGGHTYME